MIQFLSGRDGQFQVSASLSIRQRFSGGEGGTVSFSCSGVGYGIIQSPKILHPRFQVAGLRFRI